MMSVLDVLSSFFGAAQCVVQTLMFYSLLGQKAKKHFVILFTVLNAISVIIPMPLYIGLPVSIISTVLLVRFGFSENKCKSFLYGVLSSEIMWLCIGIFDALLAILGAITHIPETPAGGVIFLVGGNVLSFAAYYIISRSALEIIKREQAEFRNIMMILTPLIMIFITEIYIVKVIYRAASTDGMDTNAAAPMIVQIIGVASVFCILLSYKRCAESFRLHEKLRLYERERHYSEQYSNDAKAYYNTARSMWHDFKNHILIIGEMLQNERYRDAANYIQKLDKTCEHGAEFKFHTGSFILDVIFTSKFSDIADKVTLNIFAVPDIEETDICTIFANSADNAVHAVSKLSDDEKFIAVTTRKRGDMLFIEFENSYNGKPFEPSIGIGNITAAAEKYGGAVKIITENDRFVLRIILCNSQQ